MEADSDTAVLPILATEPIPPIVTFEAFDTFQRRVVDCPAVIDRESAVKLLIVGAVEGTVTSTEV